MNDAAPHETFETYLARRNLWSARTAGILTGCFLLFGSFLERFAYPEKADSFLVIRAATACVALIPLPFTFFKSAERYAALLFMFPILVASVGIQVMAEDLGGYRSTYYAGQNLCMIGLAVGANLSTRQTAAGCLSILGVWLVPTFLRPESIETGIFFNNAFFLFTIAIVTIAANVIRYWMAKNEFYAKQQLKQLDTMKNDFFANISHELRTPLTLSIGPIESLLEDEKDESRVERLSMARRNQLRLLRLINDLLDFAKVEAGKVGRRFQKTEIKSRIHSLVETVRGAAELKGTTLDAQSPERPVWVYVDRDKFDKIVMNLLSNAFKFTGSEGRISVKLKTADEQAFVEVSDTGAGIPEEKQTSIFDRFSQADTSATRKYAGTGIGLAMVKEYTELHGGSVSVVSQEGRGSSFTVRFPLGKAHLDADFIDESEASRDISMSDVALSEFDPEGEEASDTDAEDLGSVESRQSSLGASLVLSKEAESRIEDAMSSFGSKPCVLVVDDTRDMRQHIKSFLVPTYDVLLAKDGQEGLRIAEMVRPDIIVSDVMMPKMSGEELCERIKSQPGVLGSTPIILVTARAESELKLAGLKRGADDYLFKPFSHTELSLRVRNMVQKRRQNLALLQAHRRLDVEHRRVEKDLRLAGSFQRGLLPKTLPDVSWINIAAVFRPMEEAGGDFYDVCLCTKDRIRVLLVDVTGHGVQAAMRTGLIHSEYESIKLELDKPSDVLFELNRVFRERYSDPNFFGGLSGSAVGCEALCADIILHGPGRIRVCVASASAIRPIYIERGETGIMPLGGGPLGWMDGSLYEDVEIELSSGAQLYIHTDGLAEQQGPNEMAFGKERVSEYLERASNSSGIDDALKGLLAEWDRFRGDVPPGDDLTVLAMEVCHE